jgi:hypothetical protein
VRKTNGADRPELDKALAALAEQLRELGQANAELRREVAELRGRVEWVVDITKGIEVNAESRWVRLFGELELDRDLAEVTWERARVELDGREEAVRRLALVRTSPAYAAAYDDAEPLVTVRIASYRRTRQLVDVALASVLAQTYANLEVVIVNDGPNDATREAVQGVGDPRVRYLELPERSQYPRHPHLRWMVAGSPGMNHGVAQARGAWIAPLDDDDEFEPDHIERLLALARERRAEVAYGAVRRVDLSTGEEHRLFSDPPAMSVFSFQSALYLKALDFMPYNTESWRAREPGDWNLARRMLEAGVRFASTPEYVATMHSQPYDDPGRG